MAVLPLKYVGEKVLRRKAARVPEVDKPLVRLLDDMLDTMYAAQGIGLAGPQIGVSRRVIVVDAGDGPLQLAVPQELRGSGAAWAPPAAPPHAQANLGQIALHSSWGTASGLRS